MFEREGLLAAIRAAPDDDLPRLAFADWLDETGTDSDRAEFIRAQIEGARVEPYSKQQRDANRRAAELLTRHRSTWTAHLRRQTLHQEFARGFIEDVAVDAARFPPVARTVFDAEPIRALRAVRILVEDDPTPAEHVRLSPLFELPQLRQLTRLDLRGVHLLPEEGEALSRSPLLAGLRELCLRDNPISPDWLANFLAGRDLPNLTTLDVGDVPHVGALVRGLARSDRRLLSLDASGVRFDSSEQLQVLLDLPALRQVEVLRLGWPYRSSPGPLTHLDLGWVLPWNHLRALDLGGQRHGPEGVIELDRRPEAAHLRWLGLAFNQLGRAGARNLAAARRLNPAVLDLRGNDLTPQDVRIVQERFPEAEVVV